jgi:hypothetical protein
VPLDVNEGAEGDTLLRIDLSMPESDIADYEWIEEGKPYREWLILRSGDIGSSGGLGGIHGGRLSL